MSRAEGGCAQSHTSRQAQTDSYKESDSGVCLCSNTECEQLGYWMGEGKESGGRVGRHK